jgi:quercetin dioxygenase-like cupin family protein
MRNRAYNRLRKENINMEEGKIFKIDEMGWTPVSEEKGNKLHFDKCLVKDPLHGMVVNISKYPKGYHLPWHKHSCAHGMYVIKGSMETNMGTVRAGDLVWWPAGVEMKHGATMNEDCEFLFVTNAPYDIEVVGKQ